MLNKFHQLVASLYAGGYRFLAVFLVDAFFVADVSADFSRYFLWAGLISTFSGLPIAARAQAQEKSLSFRQQLVLCLILLIISSIAVFFFWSDSIQSFAITMLAAGLISLFEIKRMERAAEGKFSLLTLCGIASLILLISILFMQTLPADWLTAAIFAGLTVPLIITYSIVPHKIISPITLREAVRPVGANAVSSLIVTGLAFAFPLLLIEEFGREYSSTIAQVYAIATLSFSYPRYLSTGFIVSAKQGKAKITDVTVLAKKIFLFILPASLLFAAVSWVIAPEMFNFLWLFVAMQLSQLSLPYANWWTAHSREINSMKLNFISLVILSFGIATIYAFTTNEQWRGQMFLLSFAGYHLFRFFMYSYSEKVRTD